MGIGRQRRALPGLEIHHVVADGAAPQRPAGVDAPRRAARGRRRNCGWRPRCPRSTGIPDRPARPARSAPSVVVTWVSTQPWVGICSRAMISSSSRNSAPITAGSSLAGLMPIQASPEPSSRPSRIEAVMPLSRRRDGWAAAARSSARAGRWCCGTRVVTSHFFATRIRSWLRISFDTAAAISGVMPRASFCSTSLVAASDSSQSRKRADGQRGDRREGRRVMAVDDQAGDLVVFIGDDGFLQELLQRHIGQRHPRRHHLLGASAAIPPAGRRSAAASPWPADRADHRRHRLVASMAWR